MARITIILTEAGHVRNVFCDGRASVVKLQAIDLARAGGDVAYNAPEGSRALDETVIPPGAQVRVRQEHEHVMPMPKPTGGAAVSLTGKSAEGFAKQCESEGLCPTTKLRQLAATWRYNKKGRKEAQMSATTGAKAPWLVPGPGGPER